MKTGKKKGNVANTPLGLILDVNFKVEKITYQVDDKYIKLIEEKKISEKDISEYMHKYNNVIKETQVKWRVIKN